MFTAYVDESGQEQQENIMFVAGYLGNEDAWKSLPEPWLKAISPRSHLHLKRLRFNRECEREMLLRAADVPRQCGLVPIIGGVRQSDYADLISGTKEERMLNGYVICCFAMVVNALGGIPDNERLEVIFEHQANYWPFADQALASIAGVRRWPQLLMADGKTPKLANWRSVPQGSTPLTEPADYACYALTQNWRDRDSKKARWCKPILDAHPQALGAILKRDEARAMIQTGFMAQALGEAILALKKKGRV